MKKEIKTDNFNSKSPNFEILSFITDTKAGKYGKTDFGKIEVPTRMEDTRIVNEVLCDEYIYSIT